MPVESSPIIASSKSKRISAPNMYVSSKELQTEKANRMDYLEPANKMLVNEYKYLKGFILRQ